MAISSVGYSGSIGWSDWANMARSLGIDYGVVNSGDLEVTIGNATTGTVDVAAGTAFGAGVFDTLDSTEVVTGLTTPNTWYTIVVRRDWTGGPGDEITTIEALEGTSARAIAASRQTNPGVVDEQPIALVHRGSTTLAQVVDLRCWWGNGGARAGSTDALAYLGRPGSVIQVGNQQWTVDPGGSWYLTPVTVDQVPNLPASKITSGTLSVDRIPNLPASKITSGTLSADRIPNLNASKITAGTLNSGRIPNLDASKITSGTFAVARIPALPASAITSGIFADARIPNLNASKITAGTLADARMNATRNPTGNTVAKRDSGGALWIAGRGNGGLFFDSGDCMVGTTSNGSVFLRTKGNHFLEVSSVTGRIGAEGSYNSTVSSSANLHVNSNGWFSRASSSRRYKADIQDVDPLERLLDIRPRTWVAKHVDEEGGADPNERFYGAIAEELHDLGLHYLVTYDSDGLPEAISYDRIGVALIPYVREQERRIAELEAAVATLRGQ